MGFAEAVARMGMTYGDPASLELVDRLLELISYHAILTSHRLAAARGSFPAFPHSRWTQGLVPNDTLAELERLRGRVEVDRRSTMHWDSVRARVREGMRNGTVLAIAPTAAISLIAGTTPSLDPYYANIFARQTLSGKFLDLNRVLVDDLRALRLWEQVRERILAERGDITALDDIPEAIRRRHPTAYQIPASAYLEVATRTQKWVDMGISRNLYVPDHDLEKLEQAYIEAWQRGLKSTYYLFIAPRMYAEPSTISVNKARQRPRWNLEEPPAGVDTAACELACETCQ